MSQEQQQTQSIDEPQGNDCEDTPERPQIPGRIGTIHVAHRNYSVIVNMRQYKREIGKKKKTNKKDKAGKLIEVKIK